MPWTPFPLLFLTVYPQEIVGIWHRVVSNGLWLFPVRLIYLLVLKFLVFHSSITFYGLQNYLRQACYIITLSQSLVLCVYCTLVFCQQYHLFVWSVFSPKLLYETSKTLLFSLFVTFITCRAHCGVRKDQLPFVKSKWNTIVPRRIFLQCVHAIIFSPFVAFVAFMLINVEEKKASALSAAHRPQSSYRQPKLSLRVWSLIPVVTCGIILFNPQSGRD